jgi:hypothetical protein
MWWVSICHSFRWKRNCSLLLIQRIVQQTSSSVSISTGCGHFGRCNCVKMLNTIFKAFLGLKIFKAFLGQNFQGIGYRVRGVWASGVGALWRGKHYKTWCFEYLDGPLCFTFEEPALVVILFWLYGFTRLTHDISLITHFTRVKFFASQYFSQSR